MLLIVTCAFCVPLVEIAVKEPEGISRKHAESPPSVSNSYFCISCHAKYLTIYNEMCQKNSLFCCYTNATGAVKILSLTVQIV